LRGESLLQRKQVLGVRRTQAQDERQGRSAEVLAFRGEAAAAYGRVRTVLERAGTPIGPLDTLITAHAVGVGVRLVTSNTREFRRVPDLEVEDWTGA
jgi:tRNA(fMet)-specific endonuclease VapC